MTRDTYAKATVIIEKIEAVKSLLTAYYSIDDKTNEMIERVEFLEKDLSELNYKLYHLN